MYGKNRGTLKTLLPPLTQPVDVIVKLVLVSPLNVVPFALRLPLTEMCRTVERGSLRVNESPVAELSVPATVRVSPPATETGTFAPTATVAPDATVKPFRNT